MALTLEKVDRHIEEWQAQIRGSRNYWPKFLHHTAHVTVIPEILRSGILLPRAMQEDVIHDAADYGPLWNNPDAHKYCRFYFRPKTLFHVVTEGIRCLKDPYRKKRQMSVPITLLFDARKVLTQEGVWFTRHSYARSDTEIGNDEAFFNTLNFAGIFQDGATQDHEVRQGRMAEALFDRPLPIDGCLKFILCRTSYDRQTLLTLLNADEKTMYSNIIKVEKTAKTAFVSDFALFITELKHYRDKLIIKLKHPAVGNYPQYRVSVKQLGLDGQTIIAQKNVDLPRSSSPIEITGFSEGISLWEIKLEEELAFCGTLQNQDSTLV